MIPSALTQHQRNTAFLDAFKFSTHNAIESAQQSYLLGADPLTRDSLFRTALHYAALNGHAEWLPFLIPISNAHLMDYSGRTPLHCAAYQGFSDCLSPLLAHSDPNALDRIGRTPLHYAALFGYTDCVRLLLPHADYTILDVQQQTPASLAFQAGHSDCVTLIEAYACSVTEQHIIGDGLLASGQPFPKKSFL